MASKSKNRSKHQENDGLALQVERNLGKHNFKQALKDARALYRQTPNDNNHRLLERASFARAQDLLQSGLRPQARDIVQELLALKVTEQAVAEALPELLIRVGLSDNLSTVGDREPEAQAQLQIAAADFAVLHPDEAGLLPAEIREAGRTVRNALERLEAGDEAAGLALLKDIPRSSPFADWKLFARGLAAYYRADGEASRENWSRLDKQRCLTRVATVLKSVRAVTRPRGLEPRVAEAIDDVEREFVDLCLGELRQLQHCIGNGEWEEGLLFLERIRASSRGSDPDLINRITEIYYSRVVQDGDADLLKVLTRSTDPLPIDPHWNRAWALVGEQSRHRNVERIESYWKQYIVDLGSLTIFGPEDRKTAQALTWLRLAKMFVDEACKEQAHQPINARQRGSSCADARQRALEYFQSSIDLFPEHLETLQSRAAAYDAWQEPRLAADARRQLLERFPEDLKSLGELAEYFTSIDEPLVARDYFERLRLLKPLDQEINESAWMNHLACARHYALRREWEMGRAAFAAAASFELDRLRSRMPGMNGLMLIIRRAVFELAAGDDALGRQFLTDAKNQFPDPAAAALMLAIEAVRYSLPQAIVGELAQEWRIAAKDKHDSPTLGRLCWIMAMYLVSNVEYNGREVHAKELSGLLRRHERSKFNAADLWEVCAFLDLREDQRKLLEKLLRRGLKEFPGSACFHCMMGELEYQKGPFACKVADAIQFFDRALELAEKSDDPLDAALIPLAKERLTPLRDVADGHSSAEFDDDDSVPEVPLDKIRGIAEMLDALGIDPQDIMDQAMFGDSGRSSGRRRNT